MRTLLFTILLAGCGNVLVGCGNVPNKGNQDMAVSSPNDMSGSGGGDLAGTAATCTAGSACSVANGNGLCTGGNCASCTDTTDDAMCATVYGAGNFCISGVCTTGCRAPSDCGGQACVDNQCVAGCASDGDCGGATPVCNTTTMTCVAGGSITCGADDTVCPVNGGDVCCGGACVPGACCGTDACAVPPSATNNGTCSSGTCVAAACAAVSVMSNTLYVDFGASDGGNGASPGCAFNDLSNALAAVSAGSAWTIVVRGGTTANTTVGRAVPSNVTITGGTAGTGTGATSLFAACTSVTACPQAMWPMLTVTTTTHHGFEFNAAGPNALTYFKVYGPVLDKSGAPTTSFDGIHVINTGSSHPLKIEHVIVEQFLYGISVDTTGNAQILDDVTGAHNYDGLYAQNGSTTSITLSAGQPLTHFDNNTEDGIVVLAGATAFTISGPTTGTPIIGASNNAATGLHYAATAPGATITGLNAAGNGQNGVSLFAAAVVKMRSNSIHGNSGSGIEVYANGSDYTLSTIDLGSAADAGKNQIYANSGANVCVPKSEADNAVGKLTAQGNDFTNSNQSNPTAKNCAGKGAAQLSTAITCTGGVDLSESVNVGLVEVAGCTLP